MKCPNNKNYLSISDLSNDIRLLNEFSNLFLLNQDKFVFNSTTQVLDLVLTNLVCDVGTVDFIIPIDPHDLPLLI